METIDTINNDIDEKEKELQILYENKDKIDEELGVFSLKMHELREDKLRLQLTQSKARHLITIKKLEISRLRDRYWKHKQ